MEFNSELEKFEVGQYKDTVKLCSLLKNHEYDIHHIYSLETKYGKRMVCDLEDFQVSIKYIYII